jgi:MSHA biogenesis protein MshK
VFRTYLVFVASFGIGLVPADGNADAARDPTQPSTYSAASPEVSQLTGVPTLSSVLIGAERRLAVVDGTVLSEGEERAGLKVWEIKPDRVVVSVAGQKPMTLMLDAGRIHKEVR